MTQYNIMSSSQGYNVTSSLLVRDSCFELKCSFTQFVETTGTLYTVTMASINAVGVGPWSDPKQGKKDNYSTVESINCIDWVIFNVPSHHLGHSMIVGVF